MFYELQLKNWKRHNINIVTQEIEEGKGRGEGSGGLLTILN